MTRSVGIVGTGRALPERVLTNQELEAMVDTCDEWITTRTGIKERRIAAPEQAASDLGYVAARNALSKAGLSAADIDLIIVATITGDMLFPATSCLIQDRLQASKAAAFDLSAGCSGFVYALDVGQCMVKGGHRNVLVIGVDVLSRVTDYTDRGTCILFGDGAGAAILTEVKDGFGFLASELGADGAGGDFLRLPAGGSRWPTSASTVAAGGHFLQMAGNEVFKFAVRVLGDSSQRVLRRANMSADQVRWFIPHQANIRIIQAAVERVGFPRENVYTNVDRYGNTSAASIGIALDEIVEAGELVAGDHVLMVGFGTGLTWGSVLVRWGGRDQMCPE